MGPVTSHSGTTDIGLSVNRRGTALWLTAMAWLLVAGCVSSAGESPESETSETSAAGRDGEMTAQDLIDGQKRWLERRPQSYTMTVERGCFCAGAGIWTVEVDGDSASGDIADRVFDESYGEAKPPTIDGLYRVALSLVDPDGDYRSRARPSKITIIGSIDSQGVPRRMLVDLEDWFDEEISWTIHKYDSIEHGNGG